MDDRFTHCDFPVAGKLGIPRPNLALELSFNRWLEGDDRVYPDFYIAARIASGCQNHRIGSFLDLFDMRDSHVFVLGDDQPLFPIAQRNNAGVLHSLLSLASQVLALRKMRGHLLDDIARIPKGLCALRVAKSIV